MKVNSVNIITGIFFLLFVMVEPLVSFSCELDTLAGEQPMEVCIIRNFLKKLQKQKKMREREQEKKEMRKREPACNAFLLHGERGLGKTSIAKILADSVKDDSVKDKSVEDESVGKNFTIKLASEIFRYENSNEIIKKIYATAEIASQNPDGTNQPYIIIIDDIDDYATRSLENQENSVISGMQVLRKKIDEQNCNPHIITILIANKSDEIDERLRDRCKLIKCYLPDFDSRVAIIKIYAQFNKALFLLDEEFIKRLAYEMEFFTGRDIKKVFDWASQMKVSDTIDQSSLLHAFKYYLLQDKIKFLLEKYGIDYYCACKNKAAMRKETVGKYLAQNEDFIKEKYGWWCYNCCWFCNKVKSVIDPFSTEEFLKTV